MNGSKRAPGAIVASALTALGMLVVMADTPATVSQNTARYSVRIIDSRGTWSKAASPPATIDSGRELTVRCGTTLELNFESADYIYLLSQTQLGLDLVVIPQQTCIATVVVSSPGRYVITARGFCGDLWQHAEPPLRIVCRP